MAGDIWSSGSQLVTADLAVGTSGAVTRVFNIHIISGGGGGAVVTLKNGTSTSGTAYITETATVSTGKTFDYGMKGQLFPSGCFVDVDTNTTSVLVAYSQ